MNNCQPNCGCKFEVDSSCVRYTAVNLGTTLINVGDTIETTIIKIDQAITNLQQTINNNSQSLQISGPLDRVVKFGPPSTPLLPSQTEDNGDSIGINAAPNASTKVLIETSQNQSGLKVSSLNNGKEAIIAENQAQGSIINKSLVSFASGSTTSNIGIETSSTGSSNTNIGLSSTAIGATNNYSVQLKDGTQTVNGGKFLKDKGDGKANWNYIYLSDIQDYQPYSLPIASSTVLGGIKIGSGLSIDGQGVLSANTSGFVSAVNGTKNYVAKFTPNGTTVGNSKIVDNGTNIYIDDANINTYTSSKFYISTNNTEFIFKGVMSNTSSQTARGIEINISMPQNSKSDTITAGFFASTGSSLTNIGVYGGAISPTNGTNIGGYFSASNAQNDANYAIQLFDPSRGVGKYLKCITADGKANWANITASDVQGAVGVVNGTNNYVAKFTPDGTTIGNSLIQDNGTNISINSTPLTGIQFYISSTLTSGINVTLTGSNALNIGNGSYVSGGGTTNIGYNTQSYGATGANIGGRFRTGVAGDANLPNGHDIAVYGSSEGSSRGNIGGLFVASGGTSNYAVQLQDGTQGQGKFLKSITADGKANWANITAADIQGLSGGGGIGGSGTLNRIPKWTPNGTSLGSSSLTDDGSILTSDVNMIIKSVNIGSNGMTSPKNIYFGNNSLSSAPISTAAVNVALGHDTLSSTTSGSHNVAIGQECLTRLTTGTANIAIGMSSNGTITGYGNIGIGNESLLYTTTGSYNIALGNGASTNNSTGEYNIAIGEATLSANQTGSNNIAIGKSSGTFKYMGQGYNTAPSDSIYIGNLAKANAANGTNELVIGNNSIGNGTNTTTIGNTSTVNWYMHGNMNLLNATVPTTQSVTQTKYLPITINGVTYKLLLAD